MKRSEFLAEIYKAVDHYIATRSNRNLVEVIIDKAEDLGMLPPVALEYDQANCEHYYTNEWEQE